MLVGLSNGRQCSLKRSLSRLLLSYICKDELFPYVILYMYFSILSF